ncbi:MAG: methylisocitrate lyase [Flavobacteriales bacterium]|jgi:methylisocitrate lyase|nr:methylisocitrate lyase [Flavobacteriales bacterium]
MKQIKIESIQEKRKAFKTKITTEGIVLPGAYNALTAKQIQQVGFEGVYISGAALSASAGLPDIGLLTLSEFSFFIKYITQAVNLPCIADADTGFGEVVNVVRTVQELEGIGLAGMHMEDQIMPKRCGHLPGKTLISEANMCEKIQAACSARKDENFLIIARTDARSAEDFDKAVSRAKAYVQAGADLIFPEALQTEKEFKQFAKEINVPLLANMTEFGVSPLLSAKELFAIGYKIVIFPVSALRVTMKNTQNLYQEIKKEGAQKSFLDKMQTRQELYDLIDYDAYAKLDKKAANYKNKKNESK